MFFLINFCIGAVLYLLAMLISFLFVLYALYALAVFIPGIAVTVRRLHDTGKSGWWILIAFVPLIGFIVLLVFMVTEGTPGTNQYGPNPKESGG